MRFLYTKQKNIDLLPNFVRGPNQRLKDDILLSFRFFLESTSLSAWLASHVESQWLSVSDATYFCGIVRRLRIVHL